MVNKFKQIRRPQEPLAIPVTVLVSREARSLEHLVTCNASRYLNLIKVTCQNIQHMFAARAVLFHSNIFFDPRDSQSLDENVE